MPEPIPPDVLRILELVNASDIQTVHLKVGGAEVFVSRVADAAPPGGPAAAQVPPATTPPPGTAALRPAPPTVSADPAAVAGSSGRIDVVASMIGVFYRASQPGAEPYVEVGSVVTEGMTIGLIEAMKVFVGVAAGVTGVVSEILVDDSSFVEFGQPLLRITPSGEGDTRA